MTNTDSTTPSTTATIEPEHIVTRDTAGELHCTCKAFKTCAVLFGAGSCDHTRRVQLAQAAKETEIKVKMGWGMAREQAEFEWEWNQASERRDLDTLRTMRQQHPAWTPAFYNE